MIESPSPVLYQHLYSPYEAVMRCQFLSKGIKGKKWLYIFGKIAAY